MKPITLAVAMLAALAGSMPGQTTSSGAPPTPPAPAQVAANIVARLTNLLDLTSAQQATAATIFTAQVTTDQAIGSQMQTAQTALQTAITSNSTSGIKASAATIGSLTTQRVEADAGADAAFYAILTATQQSKYAALHPLGIGAGHGPGGRGGPGGPGHAN